VYISSIYAENVETDLENSTPLDTTRPSHFSKIHPTLINWQTSENPDEFAKTNNLSYKENKVAVLLKLIAPTANTSGESAGVSTLLAGVI